MDEAGMQAILMDWAMSSLHHILVLPNATQIYSWETDVLSVTRALYAHEFEVKISLADYKRDSKKRKHNLLSFSNNIPNYFWYATCGFEIEPPDNAGWVEVVWDDKRKWWRVDVRKDAPRLTTRKLEQHKIDAIGRCLAWRVTNSYQQYARKAIAEGGR